MQELTKRYTGRIANIPLLLFGLVAVYIVLQFVWWAWLLISKDQEVFVLQQQLRREGTIPEVPIRLPERTFWMVLGEGGVFLLLILLALWIIFRTVKHELTLARQQRDFLLAASHELRTPIAGLKLHLQTLLRPELSTRQRDELSAHARAEVERLHALTEKILLATRLDETTVHLERQEVDASALLRTIYANAITTFGREHHLTLIAQDAILLYTDVEAFRSVVNNLLENACKYTPSGTRVKVELVVLDRHTELLVHDEGPGVPEAERGSIFRKFHRGGSEEIRRSKGTGLGLYIVDRLMRGLGGQVEYRPSLRGGSIFAASFPHN